MLDSTASTVLKQIHEGGVSRDDGIVSLMPHVSMYVNAFVSSNPSFRFLRDDMVGACNVALVETCDRAQHKVIKAVYLRVKYWQYLSELLSGETSLNGLQVELPNEMVEAATVDIDTLLVDLTLTKEEEVMITARLEGYNWSEILDMYDIHNIKRKITVLKDKIRSLPWVNTLN